MRCPATLYIGDVRVECLGDAGHETQRGDEQHWAEVGGQYGTDRRVSASVYWMPDPVEVRDEAWDGVLEGHGS